MCLLRPNPDIHPQWKQAHIGPDIEMMQTTSSCEVEDSLCKRERCAMCSQCVINILLFHASFIKC